MTELVPGRALASRFELRRLLGRGGMGQVWQAHDLELGEQVAVKVLNPELAADADLLELLRHECRQARRLVHPNIVRIYDFHSADGHAFISMEFVEGGELGQLRDGRPAEILEKVVPLVSALAYAHGQGIVHRDVKPSNVILDREGMPRLVDFGIAALLTSERGLQLSGGGSPLSMSPEQRAGLPPSPADDVFALGVLIYELITGFPPEVEKDGPPPAQMRSRANYAIPARLQALVTRLLAAEAAWRPTDLVQVGSELEAALQESRNLTLPPQVEVVATTDEAEEIVPVSHQPTATARPHRPDAPDRRPLLWVAGAILVMALIGVVFVLPGYVDRERGADTTASTTPYTPPVQPIWSIAAWTSGARRISATCSRWRTPPGRPMSLPSMRPPAKPWSRPVRASRHWGGGRRNCWRRLSSAVRRRWKRVVAKPQRARLTRHSGSTPATRSPRAGLSGQARSTRSLPCWPRRAGWRKRVSSRGRGTHTGRWPRSTPWSRGQRRRSSG